MTYTCVIFYLHDNLIPQAINFFGKKLGKDLSVPTHFTCDNATFAISENERVVIQTVKGLSRGSIAGIRPDYFLVEDGLVTEETVQNLVFLKDTQPKDYWMFSERSLQE